MMACPLDYCHTGTKTKKAWLEPATRSPTYPALKGTCSTLVSRERMRRPWACNTVCCLLHLRTGGAAPLPGGPPLPAAWACTLRSQNEELKSTSFLATSSLINDHHNGARWHAPKWGPIHMGGLPDTTINRTHNLLLGGTDKTEHGNLLWLALPLLYLCRLRVLSFCPSRS